MTMTFERIKLALSVSVAFIFILWRFRVIALLLFYSLLFTITGEIRNDEGGMWWNEETREAIHGAMSAWCWNKDTGKWGMNEGVESDTGKLTESHSKTSVLSSSVICNVYNN